MSAPTAAGPDRLLTAKQVADLLGVAEQTLAHWRSTARIELPYLAISGRCVRYRERDVQAFIERNLVGAGVADSE